MEFFESQVGEFRSLMGAVSSSNNNNNNSNNSSSSSSNNPAASGSAVGSNSAQHHHHHHQHQHQHQQQQQHHQHPQHHTSSSNNSHHQHHHSSSMGGGAAPGSAAATPGSVSTPIYGASTTPTASGNNYQARNAAGSKRKGNNGASADDDDADGSPSSKGAGAQRSKRSRYISIACNECKRRKIKCNGETPCQRCGNLNLQCLYAPNCCSSSVKDSDEFKQMDRRVSGLQDQVNSLFNSLAALRSETVRLAPIQDRVLPLPSTASTPTSTNMPSMGPIHRPELPPFKAPGFRGPTSTDFSLDVAKKTLHKMGYSSLGDGGDDVSGDHSSPGRSPNPMAHASPGYHNQAQQQLQPPHQQQAPSLYQAHQHQLQSQQLRDPLWEFDKDEIVRLCQLHEDEVGIMYPVVKMDSLIQHAKSLATWMEANRANGYVQRAEQEVVFTDNDTLTLKLVLAMALLVEEHGNSEKAARLFESARPTLDRMLMSDVSNVKYVPMLALVAGYRYFNNEEILCWRVIGHVTRLCIELGLHRRDAFDRIENEDDRAYVIHTFWTAYVLDRRWALGVGLPWSVQDEELDPRLPYPDKYPFLMSMIAYTKLSAKVWRLVRQFDGQLVTDVVPADIDDVDQSIKKWYTDLPKETQLELTSWESLPPYLNPTLHSQKEYDLQRLQIWTYLRLNQIRTLLYTPILHTHSCIMENLSAAECVVQLAKNTIRYLSHLHNTTNIYRKMQVFYHQFLTTAIAVLFLASCHAPVNFSSACRDEFYMALELVKDMSAKSFVSKRLWSTIKSLREVAPRLGLAEDPHSTAALTMAGLATGHRQQAAAAAAVHDSGSSLYAPRSPGPVNAATVSPFPGSTATPTPVLIDSLQNGHQISSEMSKIFEEYLGTNNGYTPPPDTASGNSLQPDDGTGDAEVDASTLVGASVYQHFRDMF